MENLNTLHIKRRKALNDFSIISSYYFAETDERLKSIFAIDRKEKLIEIKYLNWLIKKYLSSLKHLLS